MSLSERIKRVRKAENISQVKFGEKLGVSRDVINNLENSRVDPKPLFINHLCNSFNINKEWLLNGTGDMYNPLTSDEEFAFLMGNIAATDNPQMKTLINVLSQIDNEEDLDLILNLCRRLAADKED